MLEWIKKLLSQIGTIWGKWSIVQKLIFAGILTGAVVGIVLLFTVSSSPSMVPLLGVPITDQSQNERIILKLDEEGVNYKLDADGKIFVSDDKVARRMRSLLIREDLIPTGTDPWAIFDVERWTLTDFERDVNLRRAITANLEQHIKALGDIDNAQVSLVIPERTLFSSDQNPTTVSAVITPRPGSDISENRVKVEGIVKLIQFAVEGLEADNITILDYSGKILNDFENMGKLDDLMLTSRMLKQKRSLEVQYTNTILASLQNVFTAKRVNIVNIDIDLEFINKTIATEEHFPITVREDNPETPYSELETVNSITLSKNSSSELFEGTGFNPEGPPGQEGQTAPAYKDLNNLVGSYESNSETQNEVVNTRNIQEQKSPFNIARMSVAVAVDGIWNWDYDDKGKPVIERGSIKRIYTAVSDEDLSKALTLVQHAVGFSTARGDTVTVQHIPFDRSSEFKSEDDEYRRQQQIQQTVLFSIIALVILIAAFFIFRMISKELERRRRLREEELARQHQAMREQTLRQAEEEGIDVEMSVQERARMEMQENAKNMAREHPEDVANLIRTWLAEE
ncbi:MULTISPECIES: flagellar basal-body MS-ring/collar protein FliF [unclassified Oceanispirochaeta]|uniref:flagellar basal-body MS-ring/collar protein FliF n=1 Tax=unclassified Oceanispirochaeta TaxID=2635722 RepID=UPI000E09D29E|nr:MULTISPECIES: flagellar basal-body MS-ring/collar protein FliF [unclassified Oceanispirochaeta]MBF9016150.1 flagellar M-ring protein FliF [Oceanispirochaeta sp. M2]NPD72612.1 flagellar M-ring protein FliF [Oceanispirochaeta sp. M1]RDG31764.1 flagellar basal body M-ring protein FliF [Oceanispirochaeta sp. M1]